MKRAKTRVKKSEEVDLKHARGHVNQLKPYHERRGYGEELMMSRGNEVLPEEEPEQIFGIRARARFYYERFLALRGIAIFINLLELFFLAFGILLHE